MRHPGVCLHAARSSAEPNGHPVGARLFPRIRTCQESRSLDIFDDLGLPIGLDHSVEVDHTVAKAASIPLNWCRLRMHHG